MKRCVIVGGAPIRDYEEIRQQLRLGDYLIFCDSGLRHMEGLGCRPDLVVGVSGRLRGAPSPAAAQPPPPEGEAGETPNLIRSYYDILYIIGRTCYNIIKIIRTGKGASHGIFETLAL